MNIPTGVVLHADAVVVVWLLVTAFGAVLAFDLLLDALADRATVQEQLLADPGRRRSDALELELVRGDVQTAVWSVVLELANVAAGLLALLQESPPRTPVGWVVITFLFVGGVATPLRLFGQRRRRHRLLSRLRTVEGG